MKTSMPTNAYAALERMRKTIEKEVFVTKAKERIFSAAGAETAWLFDFRRAFMKAGALDDFSELFLEKLGAEHPFQVGGLETAAIPLVTAIVLKAREKGRPVNGFFMRKSRKKEGLARIIEGEVSDEKVVLVDDLIGSGKSLMRQVEIMESLGKRVHAAFTVLRFRDLAYYSYFHGKGIKLVSLFELNDFKGTLGVSNLKEREKEQVPMPFKVEWYFKSEQPNFFYVMPKSAPAIDATRVYFGSDAGNFWALNQRDGSVAWKYKVLFGESGKYIFSSPALHGDLVYFGAYDGNFYALDKNTGKKRWMFMEADWIGSSPAVAPDLGLVFVGLEFGLFRKMGGIVALDAETGKKAWEHEMPEFVHGTPAYSKKLRIVAIGGNDNAARAFDARNGKLLWETKTDGEIKDSLAFDEERGLVIFGSFDSHLYALKAKTGEIVHKIKTDEAIYSTPCVRGNFAYAASLDKALYAVDLDSGKIAWKFKANGRIFASPKMAEGKLYIGANDGRFYELDPLTGGNTALFQATERIVNAMAYHAKTKKFFVPTFANELYCLSRDSKM